MGTWQVNMSCLSCKYFRLATVDSGLCRVEKGDTPYPKVSIDHLCEKWKDSGQQYYIRTGWIKAQSKSK